ncbi:MAG: hypothetical protein J6S98_03240 [Lentisphaeria bacterium]|nr:hypothetical protein [Lentisphaeria bacterium]
MAKVEMDYKEHVKSIDKNGKYKSVEIRYIVFEAADEDTALSAVLGVASKELGELPLDSIEIEERCGEQAFKVNALYKNEEDSSSDGDDDEDDEEPTISFDCGGGTKHLLYSLDQRRVSGDKDPNGAIGWNGKSGDDCEITGVDIPTAQLRETYTKQIRLSRLSTSYKKKVAALVGKVNSGTFKGWSAGEVMFLGMSYSCPNKKARKATVSFNFAIQPNESKVKVGGKTVSKKGFEYVWAISKTVANNGAPKMQVEGIYVDQVCEYASFSGLGL